MSLTELFPSLTHIVGGTPVEQGRFPFQAGILHLGFQFCGGSLISPNVVLTSARCAEIPALEVVLGCEDISDLNQCEVIPVASNSVFEGFNNDGLYTGDIQLLVLEFDSVQQPIALASPGFDLKDGQDLTMIGYGVTNPATQQSSEGILLQVLLESTSRESCNNQLKDFFGFILNSGGVPYPLTVVNDFKMCAVGEDKDACQGDSGGPIFMRCDATGEDLQVGVHSLGMACAYDGIPGVYATVFHPDGFEFIENVVTSKGGALKTIGSTAEFCVVGGTQPAEQLSDPPTPFPTFDPDAWTCDNADFAANDGCHCNCGIPDPDCKFDQTILFNCQANEICVEGVCVGDGSTTTPTDAPTVSPTIEVPPEWICQLSYFADFICDCNCGAPDPDCEPGAEIHSDHIYGCEVGETCVDDVCINTTISPTVTPSSTPNQMPTSNPTSSPSKQPVAASTLFPTFPTPTTGKDDDFDTDILQNFLIELLGSVSSTIATLIVVAFALFIYHKYARKPSAGMQSDVKQEVEGKDLHGGPIAQTMI